MYPDTRSTENLCSKEIESCSVAYFDPITFYEARMSPTLNGSSAIWCFEGSDVIEIRDGITFDFYTGCHI